MKRKNPNFTKADYGRIYFNKYGEECVILPIDLLEDNSYISSGAIFENTNSFIYNTDRNEFTLIDIRDIKYDFHRPITLYPQSNGKTIKVTRSTRGRRLIKKKWLNKYHPVYITDSFYTDLESTVKTISDKSPKKSIY